MLHSGHRGRVRNRILQHGAEVLESHELLEALLFYVIPYRDTNPLAHHLCNTFGTPHDVLSADAEALRGLSGVGESTVRFFALCHEVQMWMEREKKPLPSYTSPEALGNLFLRAFQDVTTEKTLLLLLNNRGEKLSLTEIAPASIHSSFFRSSDVVRRAVMANASFCALAHNHLTNVLIPLKEDYDATLTMASALDEAGVPLYEHFIVAEKRFLPLMRHYKVPHRQGASNRLALQLGGGMTETPSLPFVSLDVDSEATEKEGIEEQELLAKLLFYAIKQDSHRLAGALLLRSAGLDALLHASCAELLSVDGMTESAAVLVRLVGEILHRRDHEPPNKHDPVSMDEIAAYIRAKDKRAPRERIYLVLLDEKNRYIDCVQVTEGVSNSASFTPRRLLETALHQKAENVILAHTHPDGICTPSVADLQSTEATRSLFRSAGIRMLDHLIIAGDSYTSIEEYLRCRAKKNS